MLVICFVHCSLAVAQMIRVEHHIGNDPVKVQLCISRTKGHGPIVPFEIDQKRVEVFLKDHPDETIIATADGSLIECYVGGDGKYGPQGSSGEMGEMGWWHRVKPEQFQPTSGPIFNRQAAKACFDAVRPTLAHRPKLHDVSMVSDASEVPYSGVLVGGVKGTQYDYVLFGLALYETNGPDMDNVKFKCLLSPMLKFKAFEYGWYGNEKKRR